MSEAQHEDFQDNLRRDLGAILDNLQATTRAGTLAQDQLVAFVLGWRSLVQQSGVVRQLWRTQAQQAFVVWRVTLGQSP